MRRCPITYDVIPDDQSYSLRGLHLLSPKLSDLAPLPFTASEQRQEALARVGKMSIQGVQAKLSAVLNIKDQRLEIVDQYGNYILKTQSAHYPSIPENEALTMSLAVMAGLDVPLHGLVYAKDGSMTYFIKRFDRLSRNKKRAVEDFAQLMGLARETKYESSMERVVSVISEFCTFPLVEKTKLFRLTLFNFLVGNEDMHVKNFSLMTSENRVMLSPSYDLLNTTLAMGHAAEELALPMNGRKRNINKNILIEYFGRERLGLNTTVIADVITQFKQVLPAWRKLIAISFLPDEMKIEYLSLLDERVNRLGI